MSNATSPGPPAGRVYVLNAKGEVVANVPLGNSLLLGDVQANFPAAATLAFTCPCGELVTVPVGAKGFPCPSCGRETSITDSSEK